MDRVRKIWRCACIAAPTLALSVLLFGPALSSRDPWHIDDARYVQVAHEMGESGEYLVPHLNGEIYAEKPPFFFWTVAGLGKLLGSYELGGRVLAALSITGTALALMVLALHLFRDAQLAMLSGVVFLSFLTVLDRGQRTLIDSYLMILVTSATLFLVLAGGAQNLRGRSGWALAATLALLGACLTKGPIGLLFPLIGSIALSIFTRRRAPPLLVLLIPILAAGSLSFGWVALATQRAGPEFFDHLVKGRVLGQVKIPHDEPWYFYFINLYKYLLPWLPLLPGLAVAVWAVRKRVEGKAVLGLAAWVAVILIAFSFFPGKRSGYVFPFFVPVALLFAWGILRLPDLVDQRAKKWLYQAPLVLLRVLITIAGSLLLCTALALPQLESLEWVSSNPSWSRTFQDLPPQSEWILACGSIALLGLAWQVKRSKWSVPAISIGLPFAIGILSATAHCTIVPAMNHSQSAAGIARAVEELPGSSDTVALLSGNYGGQINYHTGVRHYPIVSLEDLRVGTEHSGDLWIVAKHRNWRWVPEMIKDKFELMYSDHYGVLLREKQM